jgi:DNA-binding SARP family transcriptional activator/tetratricopeptide (TPR) repeat protein
MVVERCMRQDTIARLQRHLNAVISRGPGQVVALWGEAGVGKSHTLQTILNRTPCKHLVARSTASIADLVRALPRPSTLPAWVRTLWMQLQRGQAPEPRALEDALTVTLSALAPFVLVIEDLHEASAEHLESLCRLARGVARLRGVALVASSRTEPPAPFRTYRLESLDREATDALLISQAGGELPRDALDWVFQRSQGNALFSLEFWRYLLRQGAFWSDGRRWQWRRPAEDFVPVSIEALISEALAERTNPQSRTVLEARALLEAGSLEPDEALWAEVAGVTPEVWRSSVAQLEMHGLLWQGRFAHPLFREVVIRETSPERWRESARRAIARLAPHEPERASVFIAQARLGADDARQLLEAAINAARARGDARLESVYLVRLMNDLEPRERVARALETARRVAPFDPVQAQGFAQIAASVQPVVAEAVFLHAELLARTGQAARALEVLDGLPTTPENALGRFQTLLFIAQIRGQFAEVVRLWDAHLEFHEVADTFTRSHVAFSLAQLRRLEDAEALVTRLFTPVPTEAQSLYYAWNVRAITLMAQDRTTQALTAMERTLEVARHLGYPGLVAQSLRNRAVLLRGMTRLAEARVNLQEALELQYQMGNPRKIAAVQDNLASLLFDEGRYEDAETLYRAAQSVYALHGLEPEQCDNHLDQATLYLDWQPTSGNALALRHARAGLQLARGMESLHFLARGLAVCAQAEARNHHAEAALRLAQELREFVRVHPEETDRSFLALGAALEVNGRLPEARDAYLSARAAYLENDHRENAERAALEADRIAGDLASARERHAFFVRQGLHGDASVALRYFPQIITPKASHTASSDVEVNLCLEVLGVPRLTRDGEPIVYRSRKRLELLCYLLEARIAGKSEVSALELAEVFYPDVSDREAKHTLRQQVYLIRADLGAHCVHSTTNGYALAEVSSDAERFLETLDTRLWHGAYLDRASEGWDGNVRECLVGALRGRFEHLARHEPGEAARVSRILLEMEPYDSDLLTVTLQVLERNGDGKGAARVYKEAQERFWEVSETLPSSLEEFLRNPQRLESGRAFTDS